MTRVPSPGVKVRVAVHGLTYVGRLTGDVDEDYEDSETGETRTLYAVELDKPYPLPPEYGLPAACRVTRGMWSLGRLELVPLECRV